MSAESNLQVVNQIYRNFGEGNIEGVLSNFLASVKWESGYTPDVPLDGTCTGLENVVKLFGLLDNLLLVKSFIPEKFVAQDDTVVVLDYEEVQIKASGFEYCNDWVQVWTLDHDKAVHLRTYNDTATAAVAFNGL